MCRPFGEEPTGFRAASAVTRLLSAEGVKDMCNAPGPVAENLTTPKTHHSHVPGAVSSS